MEDGSCVYPEAYLDCDGNCMNDANINGICDELEVLGCTYAAACNYNIDANVDDGQCDFSCIPSGCQGKALCRVALCLTQATTTQPHLRQRFLRVLQRVPQTWTTTA